MRTRKVLRGPLVMVGLVGPAWPATLALPTARVLQTALVAQAGPATWLTRPAPVTWVTRPAPVI